jgi:hypothetical protein
MKNLKFTLLFALSLLFSDSLFAQTTTGEGFEGIEYQLFIQLFDLTGREIFNQDFHSANGYSGIAVSTSQLQNGVYYMHIISEKGRSILSLEVQK